MLRDMLEEEPGGGPLRLSPFWSSCGLREYDDALELLLLLLCLGAEARPLDIEEPLRLGGVFSWTLWTRFICLTSSITCSIRSGPERHKNKIWVRKVENVQVINFEKHQSMFLCAWRQITKCFVHNREKHDIVMKDRRAKTGTSTVILNTGSCNAEDQTLKERWNILFKLKDLLLIIF